MIRSLTALTLLALAAPVVLPNACEAQLSFEPNLTAMFDDNIANNFLQTADKITTLKLTSGYAFGGERWNGRVFYDGGLNYYQSVTEMTNQVHSANVEFSLFSGEEDENVIDLNLSVGRGFYRGSFAFYNNVQFAGAAQYKQFLSERVINNLGYQFRSVSFSQVADLSFSEHVFSGGFSFALPTSTTVILRSELGAKYYATSSLEQASGTMVSARSSVVPDVAQLTGMVRVGQSIIEGTGLSIMGKYQWNVRKQSRFLTSSAGVIADDELFDDHYGYEGLHTSIMLTQILPGSMLLRVTGGLQNRMYSSLAAYDLDGNQVSAQRADRRSYLSLFLQKEFQAGIVAKAVFDYIRNSSNDAFYDYRNNALTLELAFPF